MKLRRPPRIAAWLIERNSPLAGDLIEEFQRGKSRRWFWRQALIAAAAGCEQNIRTSQIYLKSYLIGFAAQAVVAFILSRFHLWVFGVWAEPLLLLATVVLKRSKAGKQIWSPTHSAYSQKSSLTVAMSSACAARITRASGKRP